MITQFEPRFLKQFTELPSNVERADVFRVLVLKWFGGIYSDVDTEPLRQPASWISSSDLTSCVDPITRSDYSFQDPVGAMFGIEADCQPSRDDYWRMGYSYPIQLTQWTLASKPGHDVLLRFMDTLSQQLDDVASRNDGSLRSSEAVKELEHIGPVSLTGPVAVTNATMTLLSEQVGLRWNSLTGLEDGGQSKLVRDVLILPITAFRYVPDEGGMATWVPSPLRTNQHESCIMPKDHGVLSTPQKSLVKVVARYWGFAETGDRITQ
ncbi:hypothetical protein LTR84_006698 [Exophiala bonariae]|uniref:Initiation-specific alpha-1,6-mannosyltransferase n=1 Tax=Exophiala bonariae TaxID=1690606 RepID=A0AAV9N0V7_9EURO|nr:hypothetical protein LTR84_006698 [Exophiala bonariae]